MAITLDTRSGVPIFQQLRDRIVEAIARNELPAGTRLDSVRSVALEFGINPATVKKAYDLLKHQGVVQTSMREGTVVAARPRPHSESKTAVRNQLTTALAAAYCQGFSRDELTEMCAQIIGGFKS